LIVEAFPNLSYLSNDNYENTNTSKSLWLGLNKLIGNEIIWLNGDVVFDHRVIGRIIEFDGSCMAVNKAKVGDEEVKYITDDKGFVLEISKEVNNPKGESVGIHKISLHEVPVLLEQLSNCEDHDYFEKGLEYSIQDGLKVTPIDISDLLCMEIDFSEDLKLVNERLKQKQ